MRTTRFEHARRGRKHAVTVFHRGVAGVAVLLTALIGGPTPASAIDDDAAFSRPPGLDGPPCLAIFSSYRQERTGMIDHSVDFTGDYWERRIVELYPVRGVWRVRLDDGRVLSNADDQYLSPGPWQNHIVALSCAGSPAAFAPAQPVAPQPAPPVRPRPHALSTPLSEAARSPATRATASDVFSLPPYYEGPPCLMLFYEDEYSRGRVGIINGDVQLAGTTWDQRISSFRLFRGRWEMSTGPGFVDGRHERIVSLSSRLGDYNDQVRSLRCVGPGQPPDIR